MIKPEEALDARNRMSHTYDLAAFERVIGDMMFTAAHPTIIAHNDQMSSALIQVSIAIFSPP